MTHVVATQSFEHGRSWSRGDVFEVSAQVAEQLRRAGLVRIEDPISANPFQAAGTSSSALPAAPVSPKQTAKPSGSGGRKKKEGA